MNVEQLVSQLNFERAARQEHENQCAAKTRQLWQLRDQHEQEIKRYQEQLSVVRASLLQHLVHKAQFEQNSRQSFVDYAVPPQPDTEAVQGGDDVSMPDGSPKRRKQMQQQPDQTCRPVADNSAPLSSEDVALSQVQIAAAEQDGAALLSRIQNGSDAPASSQGMHPAKRAEGCTSTHLNAGVPCAADMLPASSSAAAVLLEAAAKLQRLVEQLTQREPAAAAELSVLQWQLTAAYGSITRTSTRDQDSLALQQASSRLAEPQAAASSQDSCQQAPAVKPAGSINLQPAEDHALAPGQQVVEAAAEEADGPTHSAIDIAAAAQLFSGASTSAGAAHIDWYYLDSGNVRGPHDVATMIRWFCSFYLEDQLPVAGVVQSVDSSSAPPPIAGFQPLRQLLQQVQQGNYYLPFGAASVGRASPCQLLMPVPASPPERPRQSQCQVATGLQHSELGLAADCKGAALTAVQIQEPVLPISTTSSEPFGSPAVGSKAAVTAGGQQVECSSVNHHLWGSAGGLELSQADGQQHESGCASQEQQQHALCRSSSGLGHNAARLHDTARQEQSAMHAAAASSVAGHLRSSSSSSTSNRMLDRHHQQQQADKLAVDKQVGRLSSTAAETDTAAAAHDPQGQHSKASIANNNTSSGWGIQAALGTVNILSAVEGIASQVAEGLDNLDSFAAGMALGSKSQGGCVDGTIGESSALDFIADFPQLCPAAVISDRAQTDSGVESKLSDVQQQHNQRLSNSSSMHSSSSSSGGGGSIFSLSLPGVWRVESLHQMLRSVSPEPRHAS